MAEMKVLIADDNATLRMIVQSVIESLGISEVDVVADGVEALRLFREKRHDLVIIDNVMPGKDGIDVLRELRPDQYMVNTHVMMITGTITRELAMTIKSEFLKIDDLIVKPVNFDKLREKISVVIAQFRRRTREDGPVLRHGVLEAKNNSEAATLCSNIIDRGNIAIVDISGALVHCNKNVANGLLKQLTSIIPATVIIDINSVDQIDEFGFGTLVVMVGWLKSNEKDVYISWDCCASKDKLIALGIHELVKEYTGSLDDFD